MDELWLARTERALQHSTSSSPAEGEAALCELAAHAGSRVSNLTFRAAAHGVATGDWTPAGDDARRTLLTASQETLVVLPLRSAAHAVPCLLWTKPWSAGAQAIDRAGAHTAQMTQALFGYRTTVPAPPIAAGTLLYGPQIRYNTDALGRLALPPTAMAQSPAWLLLESPVQHGSTGLTPVDWAARACILGAEGPLHPRRISSRAAFQNTCWRASSMVGILSSWLYLTRHAAYSVPLPTPGLQELGSAPQVPQVIASKEVFAMWKATHEHTRHESRVKAGREAAIRLLATAIPLLMKSTVSDFSKFNDWFFKNLAYVTESEK